MMPNLVEINISLVKKELEIDAIADGKNVYIQV